MNSIKLPRKHHYVPVAYLKLFREDGASRLHLFDKHTGDTRKQLPKKVMHRRDYYRQPHAPKTKGEYCLELMLDRVFESRIVTLLDKLINQCADMTELEFIRLMQYMELQYLRVPKQAEFAKAMKKKQVEKVALSIPEVAAGLLKNHFKIVINDEYRFNFMHEMTSSRIFFRYFARMHWTVYAAHENSSFVTTDNPVTIVNPDFLGVEHAGIGRAGTIVLFPLSPTHCLELIHPEKLSKEFDPASVVEAEEITDRAVRIRYGQVLPPEKVEAANWIMADNAERFIVADNEQLINSVKKDFAQQPIYRDIKNREKKE